MDPNNGFFRKTSSNKNNNFYVANNYPVQSVPAPKSKLKLLIIVLVVAVFLISIFSIVGSGGKKSHEKNAESEAYHTDLIELSERYRETANYYQSNIPIKTNTAVSTYQFFPARSSSDLEGLAGELTSQREKILSYDANIKNHDLSVIEQEIIDSSLQLTKKIEQLYAFYNAFFEPIDKQITAKQKCELSDKITELIDVEDEIQRDAAIAYKDVFCAISMSYYYGISEEEFELLIKNEEKQINIAINKLNTMLEWTGIEENTTEKIMEIIGEIE